MSANRRPRKAHRPRPAHLNALAMALVRAGKLLPAEHAGQVDIIRRALLEFSAGRDCWPHWRSLADAANVAETLSAMGIGRGQQAADVLDSAQAALAAVHRRHAERGSWTLYAAELDALHWLIALHAKQLAECSRGEFERALDSTHERLTQALAGNAPRDAVIVVGQIAAGAAA